MNNFRGSGRYFETVLLADAAPGEVVIDGGLKGVTVNGGKAGDVDTCDRFGEYEFSKATGAIARGEEIYWSAADKNVTKTAGGNDLIGWASRDAAAAAATCWVIMKG